MVDGVSEGVIVTNQSIHKMDLEQIDVLELFFVDTAGPHLEAPVGVPYGRTSFMKRLSGHLSPDSCKITINVGL